jgi:hypothetical protein
MKTYTYNAWKVDSKMNPIENTDRTLSGFSEKAVLRFLAFEENVPYNGEKIVRLNDNTSWIVSKQ